MNNLGLLLSARDKVLNSFKSRLFLLKKLDKIATREPAKEQEVAKEPAKEPATEPKVATKAKNKKTKRKISSLKLSEGFLNKIKNEEKNINEQIFKDYFISLHHIKQKVYTIVMKLKMMMKLYNILIMD